MPTTTTIKSTNNILFRMNVRRGGSNNAVLHGRMTMPSKDGSADGSGDFASSRAVYRRTNGLRFR